MEAKDTVMTNARAAEIYEKEEAMLNDACCGCPEDYLEPVLLSQAEISFNAGYEKAEKEGIVRLNGCKDGCALSIKDSRQAGMKKVVEWVNIRMFGNSNGYIFDDDPTFSLTVFHKQFHAQLKEWGLD